MQQRFESGQSIIRREVLHGLPWMHHEVKVVSDDGEQLAVLLEPGSRFTFHDHPFGRHPWAAFDGWGGTQVLQVHREGDRYAIWRFFDDGAFRYWYVNFEAPFVRRDGAFDTDDHGLDLIIHPDGSTEWKDVEHLNRMRRTNRMTTDQILDVLEAAEQVTELISGGDPWWLRWDGWHPGDPPR